MCLIAPLLPCNCAALSPAQMGLFDVAGSPDEAGPDGTIGAQVKTAPAVRQHCGSGASPTNKESTDG